MSSFEAGSAKTFLTCFTGFKLPLDFGCSLTSSSFTASFFISCFGEEAAWPFSIVANKLPSDTLSPIFTFKSLIRPAEGDGISTLDLSLSMVTMGSFLFIWSHQVWLKFLLLLRL